MMKSYGMIEQRRKNKQLNNVSFALFSFFFLFQLDNYLKREKQTNMTDNTSTKKNNMNNDKFKSKNIKLDVNNEILHKLMIRRIVIIILIILEHK